MNANTHIDEILKAYRESRFEIDLFMGIVSKYIFLNPKLNDLSRPHVHSYKARLKDEGHLAEKIKRKWAEGRDIDAKNLFTEVTDLAGVRILHLFQAQFKHIDAVIRRKIEIGDWFLHERPRLTPGIQRVLASSQNSILILPKNHQRTRVCIILSNRKKPQTFAARCKSGPYLRKSGVKSITR